MSAAIRCLWIGCLVVLAGCAPGGSGPSAVPSPQSTPPAAASQASAIAATAVPVQYVLIGRARGDEWDNVVRGAQLAMQQLGLADASVLFYAPEREDPAAQIVALERFTAQKVRGIALAPSDARALELSIQRVREAGIWLTTYDTDAPQSPRVLFIGATARTVGREAAAALLKLAGGQPGKAALGSTVLDDMARARIGAFAEALSAAQTRWTVLDALDDRRDASVARQAVKASLNNNKDLVAAFGVYGYNSAAWCSAIRETQAGKRITAIGFELNPETVACLKDGGLDALIAPRPFAQGMRSLLALDSLARKGLLVTTDELQVNVQSAPANWIVDVGVDVVSLQGAAGISLAAYAAKLDEQHAPHVWQP